MLGVSKKKVAVRAEQSRKKGAHKEAVAEPALQLDMGAFLSALNSMLRATMVERAAFCFRAYDKKNKGEVDRMQIFRMACDRFQATPCSSCAASNDRAASDRTGIGSGLQNRYYRLRRRRHAHDCRSRVCAAPFRETAGTERPLRP